MARARVDVDVKVYENREVYIKFGTIGAHNTSKYLGNL
jgi:hypothetical protein